jgi:hypothetical protein
MKQFVICGVVLSALLFPIIAESSPTCARPDGVIGTPEKLAEQNAIIDKFGVPRMEHVETIRTLAEKGKLVKLPDEGLGYYLEGVGENKDGCRDYLYPEDLKYVHPAVTEMVWHLGVWFAGEYPEEKVKVSGATRDLDWQEMLKKCNGNAARGEEPSKLTAHLSGLAFDISKKTLTEGQVCALWDKCLEMQERGWVLCTDETVENNIHIFVHPEFTVLETLEPHPDDFGIFANFLYGP